jgi:alkylated DNA repair dioxygenase AlkB
LKYFYVNSIIVFQPNKMQTERSFLKFEEFPDKELLEKCVADVTDNLDINPPLGRKMFGKDCFMRRGVGFFSDESIGYYYSGQLSASRPMTSSLTAMLALVNSIYGTEYNGILVNKYFSGQDYISAHSDDESNLDDSGVVAISWGATRKFRIRKKGEKGFQDFPMISGSMLQMGGDFQKEFTHEVPRETKVNGVRISFTFRKHTE